MMALIASGCGDHQGAAGPRGQGKTAGGGKRPGHLCSETVPAFSFKKKKETPPFHAAAGAS